MKHFRPPSLTRLLHRLLVAVLLLSSTGPAWAAPGSGAGTPSGSQAASGLLTGPRVTITTPSATGAYTSTAAKVSLGGSIDTRLPLQSVRYTTDQGARGVVSPQNDRLKNLPVPEKARWIAQGTGHIGWQTAAITLQPGVTLFTVTATDLLGHTGSAVIRVSYQTGQPAIFHPATDTLTNTATLGVAGGTTSLTAGPEALRGTAVTFPAGALPATATVSLGYNPGSITFNEGDYAGAALVLNTGSIHDFNLPVTITAPLADATALPVPYYLDTQGKLHLVQLTSIDRPGHTFSFQTFHASWYTWTINHLPGNGDLIRTQYTPAADGFQVVNPPSIRYFDGGICLGMTAFSLWYFQNAKSSKGSLYPKYMSNIGSDASGASLIGQQVVASRAFVSVGQHFDTYYKDIYDHERGLTEADRFGTIENAMNNTAEPVLIILGGNPASPGVGHSVLAYKLSRLLGNISVYDPNHPGQDNNISYDPNARRFSPYAGFTTITYGGDGSIRTTESYQHILDDAEAGFHSSVDTQITITRPTNGEHVSDRNVNLHGTVRSGQVLATKLTAFIGSTSFSTNLRTDGTFDLPVSLQSGVNQIEFKVEGQNDDGANIELDNNLHNYNLVLDDTNAVMLVTLTWDTADTDVDLYVTDPTGDTSWYGHRFTADGGVLDHDITTGYGPEHWTLLGTNTVRYNQPYKVRLHYYSDHGHGPTNYTLTTTLYEGTSRRQTKIYRGNLGTASPSNAQPGAAGADWVNIDTYTLTPPPATP